jgi:lysophospholipase L1-like esterase
MELPTLLWRHDWQMTLGTGDGAWWEQVSRRTNRPDPELIHLHWPNSRFRGAIEGNLGVFGIHSPVRYAVDVRYDQHGFRNAEDLQQADVVAIGDSFVEAAIIADGQTVTDRLAARLGRPVANLGQSGYGLRQELAVMRRFALPLRPRLALWFFFGGNDLRDVEHYEWALQHIEELQRPAAEPLAKRALVANLPRLVSRLLMPRETTAKALDRSGLFGGAEDQSRVFFGATEEPWLPHDLEVAQQTLREANTLTSANDCQLVVVYIPRKFRVYRDHCHFEPGSRCARWELNDLPKVLEQWCRGQGIAFFDTTAVLEARVAAGHHTYYPDDVHWNPEGHRVVAEALAQRIEPTTLRWRGKD